MGDQAGKLTPSEKAALFEKCQQNAMGLWSMTRPMSPLPGGVGDAILDTPKSDGPKILETEEPAKAA